MMSVADAIHGTLIIPAVSDQVLSSTLWSSKTLMLDRESAGVTRTAHNKIFVAPPLDFDEDAFRRQLEDLRLAAERDNDQAVVEALMEIVKTYHPNRDMLAG